MEMCLTVEERLDKQRWYIGEVTQEVAESLLSSNKQPHSFVVFTQPDTRQYILSRFPLEGLEDGVIEHLAIHCDGGKWWVTGQMDEYDDVIEAVNCYVLASDPPLMPVVQGNSFVTQISLTKAPPEYDKANRALKPDIAALPDITKVKVADKKAVEVQNERSRSDRRDIYEGRGPELKSTPTYSTSTGIPRTFCPCYPVRRSSYQEERSTWHRYEEHHRCHPRNVCSGCCHAQEYWNGKAYVNSYREWYNPRGSGPLRVFGLILFWLFCLPCVGCYGCYKCCLRGVRFCFCHDAYYGRHRPDDAGPCERFYY